MNIVSITDFRNNIADYLDKVVYTNEPILIKKGKSFLVEVSLFDNEKRRKSKKSNLFELAGLWKDIDTKKIKEALKEIEQISLT
jgi:hypothetical protein